jgi:hypothetical protein
MVRWFLRSGLRWAILALLIVALLCFLFFVPQLQGEYFSQGVPAEERPALVNEYRMTWAQIIGGFGLLLGLYFAWRRIEISQQELEATRDQQVTERFTRAIDQLGATDEKGKSRLEVRLGGIYALERLANDSPNRDYSTIMEVLTAYVRENAPRKPTASEPTNKEPPAPLADIQAILTVLGRRKKAGQEGDVVLDLSMTDLRGARLEGAHLQRAVLQRANLERARLERAHLERANLRGAILKGAHIEGAHLEGTVLRPYLLAGDTDKIYDVGHLTIAEASEGGLTQDQIEQAYGDEHTLLPPDLEPPAHWGVKPDRTN